jgi:hypothetical protein
MKITIRNRRAHIARGVTGGGEGGQAAGVFAGGRAAFSGVAGQSKDPVRRASQIILAATLAAPLGGCSSGRQYVYNCNAFAITVDGSAIGPFSYVLRRTGLHPVALGEVAAYPDGSPHPTLRVGASQISGFAFHNTWITPANVCHQFPARTVIVDVG